MMLRRYARTLALVLCCSYLAVGACGERHSEQQDDTETPGDRESSDTEAPLAKEVFVQSDVPTMGWALPEILCHLPD